MKPIIQRTQTTTPVEERSVEHLIDLAESLGLSVVERQGRTRGGYHDGLRQIRINPGSSRRVSRSFLAHEIGHALFRDSPTPYGPVNAKQERRAWEWAALYLVDRAAFSEAERLCSGHDPAMAYELDVSIEIIAAFRRLLTRVGEKVYVKPGMGEGVWIERVELSEVS